MKRTQSVSTSYNYQTPNFQKRKYLEFAFDKLLRTPIALAQNIVVFSIFSRHVPVRIVLIIISVHELKSAQSTHLSLVSNCQNEHCMFAALPVVANGEASVCPNIKLVVDEVDVHIVQHLTAGNNRVSTAC
jgi:hypothetical protein